MRLVIQRVNKASVEINSVLHDQINQGLLIFVGIEENDCKEDIEWLCGKISRLRVFDDENGIMNLSINDINGQILVVSQFTLHASTKKGNRPSYIRAAKPEIAIPLYESFINFLKSMINSEVKSGVFGAMMNISLINNGPVTIIIDSKSKE